MWRRILRALGLVPAADYSALVERVEDLENDLSISDDSITALEQKNIQLERRLLNLMEQTVRDLKARRVLD